MKKTTWPTFGEAVKGMDNLNIKVTKSHESEAEDFLGDIPERIEKKIKKQMGRK